MKISFFEIEKAEEEYLKENLKGHDLFFSGDELTDEKAKLMSDTDILSVFIYSKVNKKILSKFKNLKAIVTRSTGFDHIDLKETKKMKIPVLNVPSYGENTVAEHTFALILALSRKIHKSYERTIRGDFSLDGLVGFDLKGKTIGIIGIGNIGKNVARIANGFEMKVLAYSPKRERGLAKKLNFRYTTLENLLKQSDIVTLHCPHNKETHHLINKKTISLMKNSAYLINTARGGNVDTEALVMALAKKSLGGAALDVLEEESLIKEEVQMLSKNFSKENLKNLVENHMLLTFDNVIITPHNAFNSKEALQRIVDTTLENIINVIKKKKLKNQIK